ncbi:MAG: histidine phosphatase family protein [Planctomycetota bacterium]
MPKTNDLDIVLIRVGPTEWDEAGRLCGDSDLPLCAAGVSSAQASAELTDCADIGTVFCGSDEASRRTAEIVAAPTGAKLRTIEDLDGVSLGLWEGLLETEAAERYPTPFRAWMENPSQVTAPEGESAEIASARLCDAIVRGIERRRGDRGRPVAIVLRPIAFAWVAAWLREEAPGGSWAEIKALDPVIRMRVSREVLRERRTALRAVAG